MSFTVWWVVFGQGQKQNERKMTWIGWDIVCRWKMQEGLSFKDLNAFNLAMLGEQSWRLSKVVDTILQIVLVQVEGKLIWKSEIPDAQFTSDTTGFQVPSSATRNTSSTFC